jgi:F0F1-type ATP synthase assembly protein I
VGSGKKPLAASFAEYSSLALLLPVSTFVGYLIGGYLDRVFATHWLTFLFLILGSAAGFTELIRRIVRDSKDDGHS